MLCINFVALFRSCSFRYHGDTVNGEVSPDFLTIDVFLVSITVINGALHRETGALKFLIEGNNIILLWVQNFVKHSVLTFGFVNLAVNDGRKNG